MTSTLQTQKGIYVLNCCFNKRKPQLCSACCQSQLNSFMTVLQQNHATMKHVLTSMSNYPRPQQFKLMRVGGRAQLLNILAFNRVNVVAVTTILVVHVGVIGHHVPCHYDFMFPRRSYHARLRARGVRGALPPGRGVQGSLTPLAHKRAWYERRGNMKS